MSDAINTPLPVEPLGYAQERADVWLTIIRGVAVAAIVLALARILFFDNVIVAAFAGGPVPWRFPAMVSLEGLFFAIEVAGNAAAAGMLGGAIGARTLRPWARPVMLWSAVALIALLLLSWGWPTAQLFTRGGLLGAPWIVLCSYAASNLGMMVGLMVAPMFIVWLMRRDEVRRRFEGQVV